MFIIIFPLVTVWFGACHAVACVSIIWRAGKTQIAGSTPRYSDLVGLGWGPRICISHIPGDADAAVPGTTLGVALASTSDVPAWVGSLYLNFSLTIIEKPQYEELVTR